MHALVLSPAPDPENTGGDDFTDVPDSLMFEEVKRCTEIFVTASDMVSKIQKSVESLESKVGTIFKMVDEHIMTFEHSDGRVVNMMENLGDVVETRLDNIDDSIKKIPKDVKSMLKENWDHGIKFVKTTPAVCEQCPDPGNLLRQLDTCVMVPFFHVSTFWK